jgi:hypothetical protein
MKKEAKQFNLPCYHEILSKAIDMGYVFQTFSDYLSQPKTKVILLRHDVDVSLEYALAMARVEHELKVLSTYFVRVHSTGYNLFDRHNYKRLQELVSMGFEIGMHQEVCNFANNPQEALGMLIREKAVIENILGQPINGVATHLPKQNTIRITPEMLQQTGFRYSPGSEIFNESAIFVSDSQNRWKRYTFEETLGFSDKILANIHPVWWVGNITDVEGLIRSLREGN